MLWNPFPRKTIASVLFVCLAASAALADSAKEKFYQAFYLENEKSDWAAAAKLYKEVVADKAADAQLRADAKQRLAGCQEEVACADFARLMPPTALAYVEINRPADQILKLLQKLGLVLDGQKGAADAGARIGLHPALLKETLGIRGAAIAVTGIDPTKGGIPTGVAVLHPGDVGVIRGLIETGLPAACKLGQPIAGHPTYEINIENEFTFFVTLTARLIVASPQRSEIEQVVERLQDPSGQSLATNPDVADILKGRDSSLLFFCINAKPMMPLLQMGMAAGAAHDPHVAMASALLDLKSLRAVQGRFGINDDGCSLEISLHLDKGHRNLVYNFLRFPAIDRRTLQRIPEGTAAFFAGALNEAESRHGGAASGKEDAGAPVVTALDFGREIFANLVGYAFFVLPSAESGDKNNQRGFIMPDVGAVLTVNDPAKSQALWTQILGLASMATGTGVMEGSASEIDGVKVRSYRFPEGITIHFAAVGNDILVSPSKSVIARCLATKKGGKSVLEDAALSKSMARVTNDSVLAVVAHPGRCLEIAKRYMNGRDREEIARFEGLLKDVAATLVVEHSDEMLRFSTTVTGLPNVSGLVTEMVRGQFHGRHEAARRPARPQARPAEAARIEPRDGRSDVQPAGGVNPADAARATNIKPAENNKPKPAAETPRGANMDQLRQQFDRFALKEKNRDAALACAGRLFEQIQNDANALNNFAWALVDEDRYENRYNDVAMRFSRRSNELTNHSNWAYLDTLAWTYFKAGNAARAVELEKKALAACRNEDKIKEVKDALKRFEAGLRESGAAETETESKTETETKAEAGTSAAVP